MRFAHNESADQGAEVMTGKVGGAAMIVVALGLAGFFGLEGYRGSLGFEDADNPAVMLQFLRQHPQLYSLIGAIFVVIAAALVVAVVAVWHIALPKGIGIASQVASVFGLFSAAFFFAQGVLRVQSPGTIVHIDNLSHQSGLAAYAAVQMAGTQGFGSSGAFALAIWGVGTAIGGARAGLLSKPALFLTVLPALFILTGLGGPLLGSPDGLYVVYMLSLLGLIVWCFAVGLRLLSLEPPDRAASLA